jgi:predicted ATP-dependent Lon-type protease
MSKGVRGETVVVGGLNLGGCRDPVHNAIDMVELTVERGAAGVAKMAYACDRPSHDGPTDHEPRAICRAIPRRLRPILPY